MRDRTFSLPNQLLHDPEAAWNFWLLLHNLADHLWDWHESDFIGRAQAEAFDWAERDPDDDNDFGPADPPLGSGPPDPAGVAPPAPDPLRCAPVYPLREPFEPISDDDIPF